MTRISSLRRCFFFTLYNKREGRERASGDGDDDDDDEESIHTKSINARTRSVDAVRDQSGEIKFRLR